MSVHCAKHDVIYGDGGTCWCCEDSAMTREEKDKAYKDPAHLRKRTQNAPLQSVITAQPENFTDEQLIAMADRLEALMHARHVAAQAAPPAEPVPAA